MSGSRAERAAGARGDGRAVRAATVAVFGVLAVVAALGNHVRVADVDPQFLRDVIERTVTFGGTFYENGIYNKGPLEPFAYYLARRLGGYDGFWYVLSAMVALAAAALAWAAARLGRAAGANRHVALAAGAAVFVHMTLSPSDYAGVLYSRNLTIVALAAAAVLAVEDRWWSTPRRATASAVAVGVLLGVAVQALLTTAFAAAAVGVAALVLRAGRAGGERGADVGRVMVGTAVVVVPLAPAWYIARGAFDEFWAGWWVHARYMNEGTGRSLGGQLALGWDKLYAYYQQRPMAALLVAAFAGATVLGWSAFDRRTRVLHAMLGAWLAGAWIEQVLSQRYSSHYYAVVAAPTALMAAVLAGHAWRALARRERPVRTSALPLVVAVVTVWLGGTKDFVNALEHSSRFTSFSAETERRERNQGGSDRTARAVLDLVTEPGDALLASTAYPWPYLDLHRVSATRFVYDSFLVGAIYLGRTSPEYVLPRTWDWFARDVAESDPQAYLWYRQGPPPGSPFEALVREQFTEAYRDPDLRVSFRAAVARDLLEGSPGVPWAPVEGAGAGAAAEGWASDGSGIRFRQVEGAGKALLSQGGCYRLSGTIDTDEDALPAAVFLLTNPTHPGDELRLTFDGDAAASGDPNVEFRRAPTDLDGGRRDPVPFSIVVGKRSAAFIVNGRVRSAGRLWSTPYELRVESRRSSLQLADLRVGPAPAGSGC